MGVQQLMILVMILFSFCHPASYAAVSKNLVSENMQENSGIVNQTKYTTAVRGDAGGGHSPVETGNGNGGQSNSSPQGGGTAMIPVYAAGAAAGQRRNHKGAAAACTPWWKEGFAVVIAVSLLMHIYV